jgi:hypothetical protein
MNLYIRYIYVIYTFIRYIYVYTLYIRETPYMGMWYEPVHTLYIRDIYVYTLYIRETPYMGMWYEPVGGGYEQQRSSLHIRPTYLPKKTT